MCKGSLVSDIFVVGNQHSAVAEYGLDLAHDADSAEVETRSLECILVVIKEAVRSHDEA